MIPDDISGSVLPLRFQLVDGRTRPDFLFVGGAKCGSTSFAIYLEAHPQVCIRGPKEPNFWSWGKYQNEYQDFFVNESPIARPAAEDRVSGEFSTSYLLHPAGNYATTTSIVTYSDRFTMTR